MEEDLVLQYEDELEAMRDLEDFDPFPMQGRKSLNFSTPTTNHVRSRVSSTDPNDSLPVPLPVSPAYLTADTNNSPVTQNGGALSTEGASATRKRRADQLSENISDDEDEALYIDEPLPEMAPRTKRPRVQSSIKSSIDEHDEVDDLEITPPPSPKESHGITSGKAQELLNKIGSAVSQLDQDEHLIRNYDFERKRVHKRIPAGAFIPATSEDGTRAYMNLKSKEILNSEIVKQYHEQNSLKLLGTPLAVLKAQLEEERHLRLVRQAEHLTQVVHNENEEDITEDAEVEEHDLPESNLWVEKYTPRQYTELLSDEFTNRTLLKWLKLWDYVVFNKALKDQKKKDQKKQDNKTKFINKKIVDINEELDNLKRPQQKIALLCGPPGLGKTTLAHVIARHAGYNVVEMNASDDRSADIFKQRIEAATQMKAVLGADPRPNCLIIDEIDGAPQPAINMLLTFSKQERSVPTAGKRKKETNPLLRPIICICNDLYTPALRQLRQIAMIITFPPTVSSKLAGRLAEVTRHERLQADLTTLLALCEKADNDIRSCLNTLQFLKTNKTSSLSLGVVQSMSLGQKDAHRSLFSVWQHIFTMPKAKQKRYVNPHDRLTGTENLEDWNMSTANNTSLPARFNSTLQVAIAAGESQKVMQGLYENYLEAKVKDPRMEAVQLALEWIQFSDVVNHEIGATQNYTLMRYSPYISVAFHLLFAANHPHKLVYPHAQFEFTTKLMRTENIVSSMTTEVAPSVRRNLNVRVTVTEVLPSLLGIIQPTLRPVNTQLYSKREKDELAQLICVMIAYNITYLQQRSIEGQYNYLLEPNMEDVTKFPNQKSGKQLTYAAKQLIAREIDLEKMRRSESTFGIKQKAAENKALSKTVKSSTTEAPTKDSDPGLPNHLRQQLKPMKLKDDVHHPATDFFGQRIQRDAASEAAYNKKKKQEVIGGDIWFRFKEGFTNAVRKTVRVQDLI